MKRWCLCLLIAGLACAAAAPALAGERPATLERPAVAMTPSHLLGIKQLLAVLVIGLSGLGVAGVILVATAASPDRVARAEQVLCAGRWRVVVLGVVTTVALVLAAALVGKAGEGRAPALGLVALLFLGFLAWLAVFGLAATASRVGRGLLAEEVASGHAPWRRMGLGALVLGATLLVPIFGWVLFLYLACRGVGATVLTLLSSGAAPAEPASSAEHTP